MWCQGSDGYWYNVANTENIDRIAEQFNLTNCSPSRERSSAGLEAIASDVAMFAVVNANGSSEIVYNPGVSSAFLHLAKLQKYSELLLSDKIISILEIRATKIFQCSSETGTALTPDDQVWAAQLAGFTQCQEDLNLSSSEEAIYFVHDGKVQPISTEKKNGIMKEYLNFKNRNRANEEKLASKMFSDSKTS